MKLFYRVVLVLVILLIGTYAAPYWVNDPGYVQIRWMGWNLESTAVVGVFLVTLAYILFRASLYFFLLPSRATRAVIEKHQQKRLEAGMLALSEGQWEKAERALVGSAKKSDIPAVQYIAAARAAQGQEASERRDSYLSEANHLAPQAKFAVELTRAELLLDEDDTLSALQTLHVLQKERPRHPQLFRLLARAYQAAGQWNDLEILLKSPRSERFLGRDRAEKLRIGAISNQFVVIQDPQELDARLKKIKKEYRHNPEILGNYLRQAIKIGHDEQALKKLIAVINKQWSEELIELISRFSTSDPMKLLKQIEQWLLVHSDNPMLLLSAGRVALHAQLWGKAKQYFEASIAEQASRGAYEELAKLAEQENNLPVAVDYYRKLVALK